ncbi:MAG: LamG domain-containing protein [bacterium]
MKKIFIASLIIFIFGTIYPAYATLIGYWDFNEGQGSTAYDSSGSNYNGDVYGVEWQSGIEGSAIEFDGTPDDFVIIDHCIQPTDGITIAAWILPYSLPEYEPGEYQIVTHRNYRFQLRFDGALNTAIEDHDASPTNIYGEMNYYAGTVYEDNWHHVALTYSSESPRYIKFFIDGELVGTSPEYTGGDGKIEYDSTARLTVGKGYLSGWQRPFHGIIDELKIFDEGLAEDDIALLYREFAPQPVPEPSTFFLLLGLLGFAGIMRKTKS